MLVEQSSVSNNNINLQIIYETACVDQTRTIYKDEMYETEAVHGQCDNNNNDGECAIHIEFM